MESAALTFAATARLVTGACRHLGVGVPGFRSPPRDPGVQRSVTGTGDDAVVSVRLAGRPWPAVAADMIEGVVVANGLDTTGGDGAGRLRDALWEVLWDAVGNTSAVVPAVPGVAPGAGPAQAAGKGQHERYRPVAQARSTVVTFARQGTSAA